MKMQFLRPLLLFFLLTYFLPYQPKPIVHKKIPAQDIRGCTDPYSGPNFFVSAQLGSDSHNGSTVCPFQTIQKALDTVSAYAGHQIFVHDGIYRETLDITTSGLNILAFPGHTPIIDGAQVIETWVPSPGETYYTTTLPDDGTGNPIQVQIVIAKDILFDQVDALAEMTTHTFFQDGFNLYAQFEPGTDPNTAAIGVVKLIEDYNAPDSVSIRADDVLFSGFEIRFAAGDGIFSLDANNLTIANCTIKFANLRGILIWRGQGNTVTQNIVHSNVLSNYPRLVGRLSSWGQGISFFSGSNATATLNTVSKNHGEGIGTYGGWGNAGTDTLKIEGNTVYDSWGVNIYLDGATNVSVSKNLIYGSGDYPQVDPNHEDIYHQNIPIGIQLAKETSNLPFPGDLSDITISNNIIINCFAGITFWQDDITSGLKNVSVLNNTIVNHNASPDLSWTAISINHSNYHQNSIFENNIIQQARGYLIESSDPLTQITFDHNGWHHAYGTGYALFSVGETTYFYSEWCDLTNKCEGSLFANPGFTNGNGLLPTYYRLTATSAMRDRGKTVAIETDFENVFRPQGSAYDIGAYEFRFVIFAPFLVH